MTKKKKKQKKIKGQEIKKLIGMDVLTPKEREKIVVNHNKSQQEIKKEYDRERQRQYRLNKKSKMAIE